VANCAAVSADTAPAAAGTTPGGRWGRHSRVLAVHRRTYPFQGAGTAAVSASGLWTRTRCVLLGTSTDPQSDRSCCGDLRPQQSWTDTSSSRPCAARPTQNYRRHRICRCRRGVGVFVAESMDAGGLAQNHRRAEDPQPGIASRLGARLRTSGRSSVSRALICSVRSRARSTSSRARRATSPWCCSSWVASSASTQ
jgi:hypothetical protein